MPTQATTRDATQTMLEARTQYFRDNGFGDDGGYADAWVDFKLGPLPMPFPNSKGRLRAVRFHDLHHIVTGYATDIRGELEISAWEIGAGCKGFYAAWVLNLGGMGLGAWLSPRRTLRAFLRGRRSTSLYRDDDTDRSFETLLSQTVADTRAQAGVDRERRATAFDYLLYALAATTGLVLGTLLFFMVLPLVPVGLFMNVLRPSRERSVERA